MLVKIAPGTWIEGLWRQVSGFFRPKRDISDFDALVASLEHAPYGPVGAVSLSGPVGTVSDPVDGRVRLQGDVHVSADPPA